METISISRFKVLQVIKENKYFECSFIKKDNSKRDMCCVYEDSKNDSKYIVVYDTKNNGYRNVNIETMLSLTIKNLTYLIV